MTGKACNKCGLTKALSAFNKHKDLKDGHTTWCKDCTKAAHRENYAANRDQECKNTQSWYSRNLVRARGLRIKKFWPGSTWQEALVKYDELFAKQNGCCAVCGRNKSMFDRELSIDHNHETKEVRGLLCNDCNHALGLLKADSGPDFARRALEYIEKSYNG